MFAALVTFALQDHGGRTGETVWHTTVAIVRVRIRRMIVDIATGREVRPASFRDPGIKVAMIDASTRTFGTRKSVRAVDHLIIS